MDWENNEKIWTFLVTYSNMTFKQPSLLGEIIMNPPKPEPSEDEIQEHVEIFSRVASGGSFQIAGVPAGNAPDIFPPCKITDLEVIFNGKDDFFLSWTAPGNDYDVGKGE